MNFGLLAYQAKFIRCRRLPLEKTLVLLIQGQHHSDVPWRRCTYYQHFLITAVFGKPDLRRCVQFEPGFELTRSDLLIIRVPTINLS